MSDKKNAAAEPGAEKAAHAGAPKFKLERLRQDCLQIFGVTTSTFDGATCGKSGEYTIDEAKKIIDGWLKTSIALANKKDKKEE
jgi:hypothetical protein